MSDSVFTEIHAAQEAFFREKMPYLHTVRAYEPQLLNGKTLIETPALLLDVAEIKPSSKLSGENIPISIEFAAHCILSMKTANYELEVRNFAAKVVQLVFQNKFGLSYAQMPRDIYAFAGNFSNELGFESWIVSWTQEFYLPPINPEIVPDWLPHQVYISQVPDVGLAHIDDYELIYDGGKDD